MEPQDAPTPDTAPTVAAEVVPVGAETAVPAPAVEPVVGAPTAPPVAADDRDFSILERIEVELAQVDGALRRLDDGAYGRCEACQTAIGDHVLASDPTARYCDQHLQVTLG